VLRIAKLGVRDYLVKPFKEDQIVERVGRIVELKSRGGASKARKRFDDPLTILLVDDKTAIHDQIRAGLGDTNWTIECQTNAQIALEVIGEKAPDLVMISTSMPEGSGFWLFQKLRGSIKTERLPVFALSVKTAVEDQARAQQVGFNGIITKPIDFNEVKAKISRTLNLDSSYKYFEQRGGALVLNFPANFGPSVANDMSSHLAEKVTEAVDSGLDRLVLDLSQVKTVDITLIELGLSVMKYTQDLSMRTGAVGEPATIDACRNYEETRDWLFANSLEDVIQAMNKVQESAG
jgi:two-component system cell cycle response regulator